MSWFFNTFHLSFCGIGGTIPSTFGIVSSLLKYQPGCIDSVIVSAVIVRFRKGGAEIFLCEK